ncbi:hypothetical protein [Novosphingobium sp.]|uniref:hypothetical protein n=1 Tax=Novosphingobium sp. TaxID=1874826 RepID=UPI0038BB4854
MIWSTAHCPSSNPTVWRSRAFVNVRETIKLGAMGRLFTAATLDELAAQALSLAAELDLAVKPPRPQKGEVASAS